MQKTVENTTFQLDQRSVLQLQQFVLEFASQIPFQGTEHKWKEYLLKDITFRLVSLLSFNPDAPDLASWKKIIFETKEYIAEFNSDDPFWEKLNKDFDDQIKKSKLDSGLDSSNGDKQEKFRNFQHSFKTNFYHYYQESLIQRSDHSPDAGLLLAFIELFFQQLIPELNQLPGRLTEFYYNKLIRKKRLPRVAGMAHVYFEPAKFVEKKLIAKGLPLYAGRDTKNESIVFETLDDVPLSQARIKEVYTLFFTKPNSRDYGYPIFKGPQGIYLQKCAFEEQGKSFETFGHNLKIYEKIKADDPRNANFGIAISSKVLFLKEGERIITLELEVNIDQISNNYAFKELRKDIEVNDNDDPVVKLKTIFKKHITYEITVKDGWDPLDQPEVAEVIDPEVTGVGGVKKLKLDFKLTDKFNPIDANRQFNNYPAIRFRLMSPDPDPIQSLSEIELYNFFKKFTIKVTKLEVYVKNIKNLTCYNDLGVLNINQPFQPFTSTPAINSTFVIGHVEAFQKPLIRVELELTWNFPTNFGEYFNGYQNDEIKELEAYKINETIGLFPELNEDGIRPPITITELNEYQAPTEWQEVLPDYAKDCQWGYLKLQLTAPDQPFGVGLFQKTLNVKMQETMIAAATRKDKDPLPIIHDINPPLTPELTNIRLNYTASSNSDSDYQLFHIHPIGNGNGKEKISKSKPTELVTKVYEHADGSAYEGSLFIGIENLTPGLLSIYFELSGSSLIPSNSESEAEPPVFFLVSNNKFIPLTKVADTTEGFEQSGIVQLNIPSRLSDNNRTTILPDDLSWIVVVAKENAESYGRTNCIHLHGARALRTRTTGIPQFEQEHVAVAAETISRTLNDEPAIKKVWQPYPSFGGSILEDALSFSKRIAMELRHRNRPTKPEDIENIIYNAFPQVYFCRALAEGMRLEILVVPPQAENTPHHRPSFPISFLRKIEYFIKGLVSPFLQIIVYNPHYAIMQIHMYLETKPNAINIDPGQIAFLLKQDLMHRYLNPWRRECLDFGKSPNFIKLKKNIEKKYGLNLKNYIFYYYYIQGAENTRYFGSFREDRSTNPIKKHMVFILDPSNSKDKNDDIIDDFNLGSPSKKDNEYGDNFENHQIFIGDIGREAWYSERFALLEAESENRPLKGFEKNYQFDPEIIINQ